MSVPPAIGPFSNHLGTAIRKPIPSHQIYKGKVFETTDHAVDFLLSKINRHIGTREQSVQAPAEYEMSKEAVTETIVNAVAHRDYTSNRRDEIHMHEVR